MDDSAPFHESLAALSRFFVGQSTLHSTLERVLNLAHQSVKSADLAGITMLDEQAGPSTTVFTSGESPEIDQAQYDQGAGPCLTSFRTGQVVRIDSMPDERRWPAFREASLSHGVFSTMSLPLIAADASIGALTSMRA